jgi:hypothetical protein
LIFEKDIKKVCQKIPERFYQTLYHTNLISVKPCYNGFMTRDYFSRKGGPYFVGQTFSQHSEHYAKKDHKSVPIIGKVTALLKFPRFKRDK